MKMKVWISLYCTCCYDVNLHANTSDTSSVTVHTTSSTTTKKVVSRVLMNKLFTLIMNA